MVRKFIQIYPHIKIIALAVPEDEQDIIECAESGISGFVAREASIDELIRTVISTEEGGFCCPPKIAAFLFNKIQYLACSAKGNYLSNSSQKNDISFANLTHREKQILNLMADGLSNKQIATALVIEVSTVKNHVHNVLVKLGVHSRVRAVNMLQNTSHSYGSRSFGLHKSQEIYT